MAEQCIVRMATVKDLDTLVRLEKLGFTSDRFDRTQMLYRLSESHATPSSSSGRFRGAALGANSCRRVRMPPSSVGAIGSA
jgi:hypothetical protein